ncbi:MAG: hypothetical protein FWE85_03370, partial [Clostridiales bacterium]|nr:hypothetical protein [Clostridiales bacterium]
MVNHAEEANRQNEITVSWNKSLGFRLTMVVVLVSLFWGIAVMTSVAYIYRNRIDSEYTRSTAEIAKIVASMLDGEMIDHYLRTRETDDEYERILDLLRIMQRETGVAYIFVTRHTEEGEIYVFDTDEVEPFALGEVEIWSEYKYDLSLLPRLMRGERVEPYITNTRWGWLLTVREPIFRADGSVAGYAGVDASLAKLMQERKAVFPLLGLFIVAILFISMAANLFTIRRLVILPLGSLVKGVSAYHPGVALPDFFAHTKSQPAYEFKVLEHTVIDMDSRIASILDEVKRAEEQTALMLNTNPLCCQLWTCDLKIINCSEATVSLFGLNSKQEFIDEFFKFSPDYQPDGMCTREKALLMVQKALEEGRVTFSWMHRHSDGRPLPTEVTLVRVAHKDDFAVAGYTRDLSDITSMENTISWLKKETEKIYY